MSVKDRVKTYLDHIDMNISAFEKSINVSNGYVNSISKSIGIDKIENILENFPNLNIEWLLTGHGSMIKSNSSSPISSKIKTVPLIPIEAMAGWGNGEMQVMDYEAEHYVVPEFNDLNVDFMVRIKGSSMYPKYSSGDLVACKKIPLKTFFQWNKTYVLDTIQGAIVKRIMPSEEEDCISCVSENEKYPPFDLHKTDIYNLAIVVGAIRLE